MKDFRGKTAFITGGASGIGFALARALGREGAQIALADIDFDAARHVNIRPFDEIHVAGALLVSRCPSGEKFLPLNGVNDDAEPRAVFSNHANWHRALFGAKAIVDYGDNGGLSRF